MAVEESFARLREAALSADQSSVGNQALEPHLVRLLNFVKAHPASRGFFVRAFIDISAWRVPAPYYTVPFCMRELRFPEVREAVRDHFDLLSREGKQAGYMNYCSSVMHAYLDFVWEDANLWAYYSARELVPEKVPALTQRLTLPDHREQFNAVWALRSIGPPAQSALPALNALLVTAMQEGSTNLVNAIGRALESIQRVAAGPAEPGGAPGPVGMKAL